MKTIELYGNEIPYSNDAVGYGPFTQEHDGIDGFYVSPNLSISTAQHGKIRRYVVQIGMFWTFVGKKKYENLYSLFNSEMPKTT